MKYFKRVIFIICVLIFASVFIKAFAITTIDTSITTGGSITGSSGFNLLSDTNQIKLGALSDVGLLRNAAGVLKVTNGSTGWGSLSALGLTSTNLTVDTNSLFVDSVNHRVGIGTTTPTQLLTVGNSNQFTINNSGVVTTTSPISITTAGTYPALSDAYTVTGPGNSKLWWLLKGTTTALSGGGSFGINMDTTPIFEGEYDPTMRIGYNLGYSNTSIDGVHGGLGWVLESNYLNAPANPTQEYYIAWYNPTGATFATRPQMWTFDTISNRVTSNMAADLFNWQNAARTENWFNLQNKTLSVYSGSTILSPTNGAAWLYQRNAANTSSLDLMHLNTLDEVAIAPNGAGIALLGNTAIRGRTLSSQSVDGLTTYSTLTAAGQLGLNVASPTSWLEVSPDATANPASAFWYNGADKTLANFATYVTNVGRNVISISKARGTRASKTAIATGDYVGLLSWDAWSGSAYKGAASIDTIIEGTVTTAKTPGALVFSTMNDAGTSAERMRLKNSGNLGIGTTSPTAQLHLVKADSSALTDFLINPTVKTSGNLIDAQVGSVSRFSIDNLGGTSHYRTITAGGTTGNQTINKPSGTVNIAAAGTTVTVTNSLVTVNSIVYAVLRTNDATATIKNVVPAAGSFVINLGAAATAEISIGFLVTN